ncbi:MAG TPA: hypothetical protein VML19_14015 [Verrucomicrobiae bacterium]|nr:hypothetical protein [Verrucomicrobiae bacterium]
MKTKNHQTTESPNVMVVLACFVAALVIMAAFFTSRNGWVDELGFWNPPYMLQHFGKLTFPAFLGPAYFDLPVITNPPLHTLAIGLLLRLGFGMYYAEAMPAVLLYLLAVIVALRAAFPAAVKLGLLFSIGYLMSAGDTLVLTFGTRPEGELHAAWLCGLLLLEAGRLANWNRASLAAGAFLLTWASGLHYYAGTAALGVLVYAIFLVRALPWREARSRLAALALGGCVVGIPYCVLYLAPHYTEILSVIREQQGSGGITAALHRHFEIYRDWVRLGRPPALIRAAMATGIPLVVYTTAILGVIRSTRVMALAALPLQAGLLLLARHKLDYYLIHETALFAAAAAMGALSLAEWLARRAPGFTLRILGPVAAIGLAAVVVAASPLLKNAEISTRPRIHELEVARAAAREILGAGARVGSSWGEWYASGGSHWYNTQLDLQLGRLAFDPPRYFANFDAVVDCPDFCVGSGDSAPSKWFADGTLKLRGFYFGESNDQLQFVLLSAQPPQTLVGYASRRGHLYRFQQDTVGGYDVVSAVCPIADDLGQWGWSRSWPGVFSTVLQMPRNSPDVGKLLMTVAMPRFSEGPGLWIKSACRTLSTVPVSLLPADRASLVERARRQDPAMRFYRNIDEIPGYQGVGLPAGAAAPAGLVPVANVIDPASLHAESGAYLVSGRLVTIPRMGGFSGSIAVPRANSMNGPAWLQLSLRVIHGRVGVLAWNAVSGSVLAQSLAIEAASDPQTIAVRVPDFHAVTHIILTNESFTRAQLEVQSAAVLVAPE